jgi:hypothetical protein
VLVLISNTFFWFLEFPSFCLHCPFVCMVFTFPNKNLDILMSWNKESTRRVSSQRWGSEGGNWCPEHFCYKNKKLQEIKVHANMWSVYGKNLNCLWETRAQDLRN